ncbi:MAG TPA: beta-ketoacyl synthase N-terminal-like domain-containing protein [Flavobacterium sp.]
MLKEVFISDTNCITPLGFDVDSNVDSILNGISGIKRHERSDLMPQPFFASIIEDASLDEAFSAISSETKYTRLEKMMILALQPIVLKSGLGGSGRTGFILSTTKGNITSLKSSAENIEKAHLHDLANSIAGFFGIKAEPVVVSNACVSGILAVSVAKRMIQGGMYDNAFIVAGDEISEFVLSGFNSFQAMSDGPCKPYSKFRNGVTLGEAAAAVLVTSDKGDASIQILGDGSVNDANHISGPSRTGEGLFRSIKSAMTEAKVESAQIDFISAHGTATPYNDEMEAIALNRLRLENVHVNSLKGFYGHTLGASGLLETVIGLESVKKSKLFVSLGYDECGVSQPINVISEHQDKDIRYFLKTASGFGGCNTAVVFEKID